MSSIPFPTLVKFPPGQDRFLSAARSIEPGQVFLVDWPHVLYPTSLNCLHVCCATCFCVIQSQSQQFICISCKVARFCSTECLTRSHPALLCLALPSLMHQPSCQSELLYLLSAYSLKSDALLELLSLPSHLCCPLDTLIKDLETQFLSFIPSNRIPRYFSHEITSSLLSINKTYALPIANPRDREEAFPECGVAGVRAYGLYFLTSLIKHSCLPNVCAFNYINDPNQGGNPSFVFRALDEIKVGTAICRSFIEINMECKERMKKLKDEHGIECKCHRCDTETIFNKNQPTEEVTEDNSPYAEFVNQHTCNHCGDGCLAPLPPPQDGVISNLMECNKCSRKVIKDEPEPRTAEDSSSVM